MSASSSTEAAPSADRSSARSSSHATYRSASSRSARSDLPDRGRKRVLRAANPSFSNGRSATVAGSEIDTDFQEPTAHGSPADASAGPRYSSITIWAFVPDIPKEFTPASRGRSGRRGKSIFEEVTCSGRRSQGRLGFGLWKWRCLGIIPRFSVRAALITPATPAADSRWPILVFTEPMRSGRSEALPFP